MRILKLALSIVLLLTILSISIVACNGSETVYISETTPSQMLASKKWKTIIVKDVKGNDVTSQNMNFAGNAEYKMDGTYIFTDFDGVIKSIGDWSLTADGKRRIIIGKDLNDSNTIVFTTIVNITKLTSSNFVYSVTENGQKLTVEHVPL